MPDSHASGETVAATSAVAPATRSRFGFRGRKTTTDERAAVERPSRVVFQASPSTIATSLAKSPGESAEAILYWGPGTARRRGGGAPPASEGLDAVFVIGFDAADRELLRQQLAAHPYLTVAPERGLLVELAESVRENQESLTHLGLPEQYWYKQAAEQFASMEAREAAAQGKRRWVALVDSSRLTLETLDRMFPTSLVIHVVGDGPVRRGVRTLRTQAARLSAGRYLEVRGRDLRSRPEATVTSVFQFLGEVSGVSGG